MNILKFVLASMISLTVLCFSAPKIAKPKKDNVKTVEIGGHVWTAEDADHATLYSEDKLAKACPVGWHVARIEDWTDLFKTIGAPQQCGNFGYEDAEDSCDYNEWRNAGLLLKAKSFGGVDRYGFAVYPNGDAFGKKGEQATYWAVGGEGENWICFTKYDDAWDYCGQDSEGKYLVRCVQD